LVSVSSVIELLGRGGMGEVWRAYVFRAAFGGESHWRATM